MPVLERAEYVEQAYFFEAVGRRLKEGEPMQELLASLKEEILATTRLPMALDYLLAELNHAGSMARAMANLKHYFTPFQAYLLKEAEDDRGRFDILTCCRLLHSEAKYRAEGPSPQGLFFYQFEALCRNRLRYDFGLAAMAQDDFYEDDWKNWIMEVRRRVESIGVADLVYVASEHYVAREVRRAGGEIEAPEHILFGEKEGKIALANRTKEPIRLFEALQRQLGYPKVPKLAPQKDPLDAIPQMMRRLERMETRLKLLEDEQREGGIDLSKFYRENPPPDAKG